MLRVFSDRRCLRHTVPPGMPEVPARLEGILAGLDGAPWPHTDTCQHAGWREAVLRVHDSAYVERFERAVERGDGLIDSADTPLSADTLVATQAAVETVLAAADWMMDSEEATPLRRALATVRPPGHHAERDMAMGFCYFNHIAVAADYLIAERGLLRVAIVDYDVHHGNGTQHLFEARPDVLFVSLHQHPFYPGTGLASETGIDDGVGATLNVPLSAGCGDQEYAQAFEETVLPAIRTFGPDALLVSAGFDAWQGDPLGGMNVSRDGYRDWGRWLARLADEICDGRLLASLEGGYDLDALPDLVVAFASGMAEASLDEASS